MKRALSETDRRRAKQLAYNKQHGITPQSIKSSIKDVLGSVYEADYFTIDIPDEADKGELVDPESVPKLIVKVEKEMREAAANLDFERAAELRDQVGRLRAWKPGQMLTQSDLFLAGARDRIARRGAGKQLRAKPSGPDGTAGGGKQLRPRPKL